MKTRPDTGTLGELALLIELLRDMPALPDALCRGRSALFDGGTGTSTAPDAAELCSHCPEFAACTDWARRQAPTSLTGVWAGRVYPTHTDGRRAVG